MTTTSLLYLLYTAASSGSVHSSTSDDAAHHHQKNFCCCVIHHVNFYYYCYLIEKDHPRSFKNLVFFCRCWSAERKTSRGKQAIAPLLYFQGQVMCVLWSLLTQVNGQKRTTTESIQQITYHDPFCFPCLSKEKKRHLPTAQIINFFFSSMTILVGQYLSTLADATRFFFSKSWRL